MSNDIETDSIHVNLSKTEVLKPRYASFMCCKDRLNTFKTWPKQLRQRPLELAQNGFFYGGVSDQVICFCCGVILQSWNVNDVVEHEHKKWSPSCMYLRMTLV